MGGDGLFEGCLKIHSWMIELKSIQGRLINWKIL